VKRSDSTKILFKDVLKLSMFLGSSGFNLIKPSLGLLIYKIEPRQEYTNLVLEKKTMYEKYI
jgi:hypothetical protein